MSFHILERIIIKSIFFKTNKNAFPLGIKIPSRIIHDDNLPHQVTIVYKLDNPQSAKKKLFPLHPVTTIYILGNQQPDRKSSFSTSRVITIYILNN